MILDISNLTVGYDDKPVIDGLSFAINPGTFYGIIGPNGAGKSTLFKTASGVMKPWKGSVKLKGQDIYRMPRRRLAGIMAAVPQFQESLFPFRIREFVQMGRYPQKGRFGMFNEADNRIVEESLSSMKLEMLADKRINEISGGELQRVYISQALAQKPEILMLDEPTSHLDIGHQSMMLNLLRNRCVSSGMPILMIIHDLNLAFAFCDRVLLLDNGRAFSEGGPIEVLTKENIETVYNTSIGTISEESTGNRVIFLKPEKIIRQ